MKQRPIGVFDSGVGGITILSHIMEFLPYENYIYYGDSLHNPYGEKTEEEIYAFSRAITMFLIEKGCKAIVIACNTASSVAVERLRQEFPEIIFIATVPALKVAMDENPHQNVLVMATDATLKSRKFQNLYQQYVEEQEHIYLLSCTGLANQIEEGVPEKIDQHLKMLLEQYQKISIQTIVLGCTHYPLIKKNIQAIFPGAKLIDGSIGIGRQLKRKLEEFDLLCDAGTLGSLEIYNSLGSHQVERTREILNVYQNQEKES